jgi:DNA primase
MAGDVELEIGNRSVRISNPGRVYFPARGETKLDLLRYYISVGDGIVRAARAAVHDAPVPVRGRRGEGAPEAGSAGRAAVAGDGAGALPALWSARRRTVRDRTGQRRVGGADVHRGGPSWNSRRADTERPDEWRIDLDPMPRCEFATVRRVARIVHEILGELGMAGWPKTSGGHGLHVYVRIEPRGALPTCGGPRMPSPGKSNAARRVR